MPWVFLQNFDTLIKGLVEIKPLCLKFETSAHAELAITS